MQTPFAKYEGAGNDFILIDNRRGLFQPAARSVARLCDRHFGIGADGLMTLDLPAPGRCAMRYFNADGSEGEMCGNGARCFALFARHTGLCGAECRFEAVDGPHSALIRREEGAAGDIELGMTDVRHIREGDGWWFLDTGVPHYVEFVDDVDSVDVCGRGRAIRYDTARFARGTNVNFVQITGDGRLRMRTYERGVEHETLACGTGATAAALIAHHVRQPSVTNFRIEVPGGRLDVAFARPSAPQCYTDIRLTGPARRVFGGTFDSDQF